MNNYINLFKTDFFSGVLTLTKKTWLRITYAYSIYYIAALIMGGVFIAIAFLGSFDADLFSDMLKHPDPEHSLMLFQQISDMILTPEFILSFIIVFVILMIMASWNYYFAFVACDTEIKDQKYNFRVLLKLSMSKEVFKLAAIMLLLNIAITFIFSVAILGIAMNVFLGLILFLAACIVSMRFALVVPAFVIGNYDFSSSFAFSFHHINWARALKYFGISILAMLLLVGVSLIIGLISTVFTLIPFIGPIINIGFNIVFGAIMMSVIVSGITGLYYRYASIENSGNVEVSE